MKKWPCVAEIKECTHNHSTWIPIRRQPWARQIKAICDVTGRIEMCVYANTLPLSYHIGMVCFNVCSFWFCAAGTVKKRLADGFFKVHLRALVIACFTLNCIYLKLLCLCNEILLGSGKIIHYFLNNVNNDPPSYYLIPHYYSTRQGSRAGAAGIFIL